MDSLHYAWSLALAKCRYLTQGMWNTEFNIQEVIPNLYIGDFASAYNTQKLKEIGITHIVTAILGMPPVDEEHFIYKTVHVRDLETEDIGRHFDLTNRFIHDAIITGGKVLVHCQCGVSRSASIIIAYLIKHCNMNMDQALFRLKNVRGCVNPNIGFQEQLKKIETTKELGRKRSNSF